MFAQDALKRHVAIKLVRDNTDEYRVLRFLTQQDPSMLKENCVIPVLDLLPTEGFWFAVMPRYVRGQLSTSILADVNLFWRWGSSIYVPRPLFLYEAVDIIHARLKVRLMIHTRTYVSRSQHNTGTCLSTRA